MEHERVEAPRRSVEEQVRDYEEFHQVYAEGEVVRQAARCMDCGIPFCNAGVMLEGETIGCPLGNCIPEINDLVYHSCYEDAYRRLTRTHPFPEFTGRVCPALCEGSCTLGEHEPPVSIKEIEHFIDARAVGGPLRKPRAPLRRTGRRVAVVGSGPAGLACAHTLNRLGEKVVVFERDDRPGGLLMYGIPTMKLAKGVVLARVAQMEDEGVEFRLNAAVGRGTRPDAPRSKRGDDVSIDTLLADFDALVLCGGSTVARPLVVPGSSAPGVVPAMAYLNHSIRRLLNSDHPYQELLDAQGKDVVIVGGGDTGTDCVATALRQGARSVVQYQINAAMPSCRPADNPWPLLPRVLRTDYGQEEHAALFGHDPRVFGESVKEVLADSTGRVSGVVTVAYHSVRKNGRRVSTEVPGSEKNVPAQLVLVALGFSGPEPLLVEELDLARDAACKPLTDAGSYATSRRGVFAAGDMRRGQSLVVWAVMEGRDAAVECHNYLNSREL
jgi:glutamate synthase (NADPH/NADH) small chain